MSGRDPPLIEEFHLIADPGTEFHYSNLSSNWLGIIVDRATGMTLKAYAEENLFSALGVEAGEWGRDAQGHNNGCSDLHLSARDVAKFGLLYLDDGVYHGNQVVPTDWVDDSLQVYSQNINITGGFPPNSGLSIRDIGYGYQWWSATAGEHHFNFAWGHGGQFIFLLHELETLIVVTSYPFWMQHDADSWKHESANMNLVGQFITSLPGK